MREESIDFIKKAIKSVLSVDVVMLTEGYSGMYDIHILKGPYTFKQSFRGIDIETNPKVVLKAICNEFVNRYFNGNLYES